MTRILHVPPYFNSSCYNSLQVNNKLWSESTTNPVPVLRIAASRGFSELTKNVISSSGGHSTRSLKISCKMVEPFYGKLADKEIKHYQSLDGST